MSPQCTTATASGSDRPAAFERAPQETTRARAVKRVLSVTTLLIAVPGAVLACPVCFGQSDSPMAWAMNMGIFVMLLIVGGVLVGFASFFVHLMRRARRADEIFQAQDADFGPVKAGEYGPRANVQGGTV